jgi:hypothetical protein
MTQHSHSHDKGKRADERQAQEPQTPAERLPHHERQYQPDRNLSNEEAPQPGKCAVCMKPQAKKARSRVGKTGVRSGVCGVQHAIRALVSVLHQPSSTLPREKGRTLRAGASSKEEVGLRRLQEEYHLHMQTDAGHTQHGSWPAASAQGTRTSQPPVASENFINDCAWLVCVFSPRWACVLAVDELSSNAPELALDISVGDPHFTSPCPTPTSKANTTTGLTHHAQKITDVRFQRQA